jgi:hypothetical protein
MMIHAEVISLVSRRRWERADCFHTNAENGSILPDDSLSCYSIVTHKSTASTESLQATTDFRCMAGACLLDAGAESLPTHLMNLSMSRMKESLQLG